MATSFNVNINDLQYILKQIKISEDHAGGKTLLQSIMDAYGTTAANAAQLPAGLRTVDGSYNSLVPGQENLGAADQIFPRLLAPVFVNDATGSIDFDGPGGAPAVSQGNYGQPGVVIDSSPRTISNLVNDQTAGNPAAVMAALQYSVFNELIPPSQVATAAAAIATAYGATLNQPDATLRAAAELNLTAVLTSYGIEQGPEGGLVIPNLSPDIGLSPGFNAWMTFFGQFFDHGLDLVTKGGNGTVYIPLAADDPLIAGADKVFGTADDLAPNLRFMALTRATTAIDLNGDGDTLDAGETGNTSGQNTTTSFVDQNQTYTSNPSHQVFLREYATVAGKSVSTGRLLDGTTASGSLNGAVANWGEVKASAALFLGIQLTDYDVGNVPLLKTDPYGKFIPGDNGFAQVAVLVTVFNTVTSTVTAIGRSFVEGLAGGLNLDTLTAANLPGSFVLPVLGADEVYQVSALGTGDAFLNDIAHHAAPGFVDFNRNGVMDGADVLQVADSDPGVGDDGNALTYDDEMLNSHFVTGDGRGNENIALTTVHSIFHSEHNRLVDANKATLIENATTPEGLAFLNEWLVVDVAAVPSDLTTLVWDGERLFQAARFATEMQYQHLVFEEFARRVQPMVDPFIFNNSPDVDPSIVAEFAHTVYRFGHSMLTDTVDRLENDLTGVGAGDPVQETLIAAFLNPQMYISSGATLEEANANIIRGLSRELGNEIDEFVVPALQSNLLGLPLDLPALNMARGRDTGVPSLNETRTQLYNDFGIVDLKPYANWREFGLAIKNPMSVINFVAAYGTHASVLAETTLAGKRAAAYELVTGVDVNGGGVAADRMAFLNATGTYAGGDLGGLNNIDLWIGGLAEKKNEFGGMLGSTFNFIFEYQMENLQNGDRLYYLTRTQGLNMLNNLEPNTFADIVMRNTALGDIYATHLSGSLFITPDHIIELDRGIAQTDYAPEDDPLTLFVDESAGIDPLWDGLDPVTESIVGPKVVRDYTNSSIVDGTHDLGGYIRVQGGEHYVLGGTEGNDTLLSDSGIDAIWGDGGDDYINAGTESDDVFGGEGDDIIEDPFGDDVLRGNQGNDVITTARGFDLVFGDEGKDYIILGQDAAEAFGGEGDDFILGGNGKDFILGNEGDDWIEGGGGFDLIAGENSELFFNSTIIGHDVMFGQMDETDYDAESGDDIMGSGASVYRYEGMFGFDWAMGKGDFRTTGVDFDFAIPIFTTIPNDILKDRFDQVEAASGWNYDDILQGDDRGHKGGGSSAPDSVPSELFAQHLLTQEGIDRIAGLNEWFGGFDGTDARQTLFGGLSPVPGSTPVSTWRDGNILMGGDGNDLLRGRGGYDLIDGDAYLNVRIRIVIPTEITVGGVTYPAGTVLSAESLSTDTVAMGEFAGKVFFTDASGQPIFSQPAFGGRSLNSLMLDRTINPGNMSIVREILTDTTPDDNIDTAVFQGTFAEYEVEGSTDLNGDGDFNDAGEYTGAQDVNGDGFIFVRDRDTGAVGASIDGVVGASRGLLTDDRDLLKNVEQLQFADQLVSIGGNNTPATGTVTIGDDTPYGGLVTPYVGQVLTATLTDFADADGIPLDPATGLPVGLNFEWQTTEFGSNSGWSTIQTSLTYTVRSVDPGHVLRAVAVFKDSNGVTERILSAGTDNPTTAFRVAENSATGTVVGLQIPFSVDYDAQSINGAPPVDVDLTTLFHQIDPANTSGGRFAVVQNGVDFNGFPRFSIVVANGGPQLLNFEAPVHTTANQSFQFVDNQYQIVINSYSDNPANGGVLVAARQFTVLLDDVTGEPISIAPTLDLTGPQTVTTTTNGQYLDNFNTQSFANSNGTTAWSTPWVENGDNGGVNSATAGQIQIDVLTIGNTMRLGDNDTDAGNGTAAIQRTVNLAGVTSAAVSYSYNETSFDAGEIVTVTFSDDGSFSAGHIQTIQTIDGNSGSGAVTNLALTGTLTANAAIRFVVSGTNNNSSIFGQPTDFVTIDNLSIATVTTTTTVVPGTPGNDYATTYTENAAAVPIAQSPVVADADSALIMTATVRLTNAQAGDVLAVAGALPAGITSSFGPAVAGQITMYLAGPATALAFQTAIGQVRFGNPADNNPIPGVRIITVTANDGEMESNIATASVTVVAVEDATVASGDTIITNIAAGTAFVIPEWALLANDSDPDSALDVTAVSAVNGLTVAPLAANTGELTITDIAGGANSFAYTATGSNNSNATASVSSLVNANTYADNFNNTAFNNSSGSNNWAATPWVETADGANVANAGQITIDNGNNQLRFLNGDGATITRAVNLAGVASATMSFEVDQNGLDAGETVSVQFDANGDGTFETVLSTIATGSSSTGATTTVTLTGGTANSAIRFVSSAIAGVGEDVRIDNLVIAYSSAATAVNGNGNANILVGDANGSTFDGAGGNDVILAGLGDDTITWDAGDGRDRVDGGAGGTDTFVINGDNSNTDPETYRIYTAAEALAAGIAVLSMTSDIVITRSTAEEGTAVVAELDDIEELVINTGGGDDVVEIVGNFDPTSLNYNTIHVNGGAGNTNVDISALTSDHRIVLTGNGGIDQIIGAVRPQDVVNAGSTTSGTGGQPTPQPGPGDDDAPRDEPVYIRAKRTVEVLEGTDGQDVFQFATLASARGDTITDFEPGDRIDLGGIDALQGRSGNQSFVLVSADLAAKGQLIVQHETRDGEDFTVILGNTDDDRNAELRINIKGTHDLTDADFVL